MIGWGLTGLYIALMLWQPALGPGDDYVYLRTLQVGKRPPIWYRDLAPYNVTQFGRFSPMAGTEYWLVAWISRHPRMYYALNAAMLVGFVWCLSKTF